MQKLILYKRKEESIRKGRIDANKKIIDFVYLRQDFNENLLKEFENMQNKYVLSDDYKIDIRGVRETLQQIISKII